MAVRLSVIMVHSTPPTANAQQLAQGVVGELIGLPGIDLTLVEPLARLQETSTDRLTLASLSGDVAVLDWQSPEEIVASLQSIDFEGKRTPHPHDREVPAPLANARRIYAFDLSRFSRAEDVVASLSRLNADRQVRAFTLGPPGKPPVKSEGPSAGGNGPSAEQRQGSSVESSEPAASESQNSSGGASESVQPPSKGDKRPQESEKSLDLDDLIDQLDRSDT